MISTKPRFITPNDYFSYWGENIDSYLEDGSNISNQAELFLLHVENDLLAYIDANTYRVTRLDRLSPFQLEQWKLALLYQAKYRLKNGDTGMDPGYDVESGIIADKKTLNTIKVSDTVIEYLKRAGLWNQNIKNRRRFMRFGGLKQIF